MDRTRIGTRRRLRDRRGLVALLGILAALGLVAAACSSTDTSGTGDGGDGGQQSSPLEPEETATSGGRLVVGVTAETNGWNPYVNQWADAGSLVGSSMVETLLRMDNDANHFPQLATSWEPNEDFTEWDLTLQEGVRFQNGEPFDAEAAAESLTFAFTPGSLTAVAQAPMYDRVEATGDLTLTVYLQRPWAAYPSALAGSGWMLAPAMLAAPDKGSMNPIGTGPFTFVNWEQNNSLLVERNDDYWRTAEDGSSLPYLDEIEFRVIVDEGQQLNALKAGDVDMALTVSADTAAQSEDAGFTVIRDYQSERTYLQLNTIEADGINAPNPFTNIHARRALAHATDPAAIRDLVGPRMETTTSPFIEDGTYGLPDDETGALGYDPDRAREEIELYKADTGATELTFTLSSLTANLDTKISQALQAQWREVGITAEIEGIEQATYITTIVFGDYDAALFRLYGYPDPDADAVFFVSATNAPIGQLSINFTHLVDPTLDQNFAEGRITDDVAVRKENYDEAVRIINDNAVNVWLYNSPYALIAREGIRGLNDFRQNPFGNFLPKNYWQNVWIKT